MASSKKILLISGFRIFPGSTGGHLRTGNIVRALARMGHQVCVFSLAGRNADYRFSNPLAPVFRVDTIEANLIEETNLGLCIGLLQAIGRRLGMPRVWQYLLLRTGWIPRRLRVRIREADIVVSDLPWCPPVGSECSTKPWYLLSHNLEFRLLEQGGRFERWAATWMKNVEMAAPVVFRDILACAEEDQSFFRQYDVTGQKVVPILRNGVDPQVYVMNTQERYRIRAELGISDDTWVMVFTGSHFAPNLDALNRLRQFCREHEAFLREAKIIILAVGSMSREPYSDGVLIETARVPEVVPYFAAADAAINPIMRGSGSNVKLFEYLAARLPVISTEFGVRGTTLLAGVDYTQFDFDQLAEVLQRFTTERKREDWRAQAELVWSRHQHQCDIEVIVRDMTAQLPDFSNK